MTTQSFKCTNCGIAWPYASLYRECPKCRTANLARNIDAEDVLTEEEAASLSRRFNFEFYFETEYKPNEALDSELEEKLDRHIEETRLAHKKSHDIAKAKDEFDKLVEGQFNQEEQDRILHLESIMRGRAYGNN